MAATADASETLTTMSRAAAVRAFKAARTYRLVSRTRPDGRDMPAFNSELRVIDRVTSTDVYVVGGPAYALTTLNDRDVTFHTDESARMILIARTESGAEHMRLVFELDPETD